MIRTILAYIPIILYNVNIQNKNTFPPLIMEIHTFSSSFYFSSGEHRFAYFEAFGSNQSAQQENTQSYPYYNLDWENDRHATAYLQVVGKIKKAIAASQGKSFDEVYNDNQEVLD